MASPDTQSVTRLIRAAQCDQSSAVGPLLEVYFDRLARRRLQGLPDLANYDEDLALRSFYSVYRRVRDPERPLQLAGRDDLWRLLATRTISRAIDLVRRHRPGEVPVEHNLEELLSKPGATARSPPAVAWKLSIPTTSPRNGHSGLTSR
jgi:hypothetical protein